MKNIETKVEGDKLAADKEKDMSEKVSLVGLDKADVLCVLYNASKPQGMGFLQYDPKPMSHDEAAAILEHGTYFDYLKGRVMKVDLFSDDLDPWGYDRDNGPGAASRAIETLRSTGKTTTAEMERDHQVSVERSAREVRIAMTQPTILEAGGIYLGLADVAEVLGPAVERATNRKEL